MEMTTDAPSFARARRLRRPEDPARIWAPLADLTEAAVAAAGTGTVAITRGFDRNSRQRAKALRDLLNQRGVAAIEVTPAPGSDRLLADTEIAAVVNLVGAGSWQPYRLAAELRAPVLTPKPGEDRGAEVRRDVIALAGDEGQRDIALSHVAVRSENPATSRLVLTHDGEELTVPGGWLTVAVQDSRLRVEVAGTDFPERTLTTDRLRVAAFDAPHRLVRDELPIADFEGAVTFTAEPGGLVVRPV
ncbi:hypothetical protein GCM10011581_44550 [Saccharopolyspora subtropica]|uniref:Uncharacterized protein n=1 Tax=Saccharopolyspora thermophila TaxID=89367 RepID=A0A917NI95_9PSEU|nr:hypothetical protein [Saccharopolyspora subtropica]GGJ02501.1 hypothetical protein GCM10011581_44550 [Saccharopolyspora subtropica]